MIEYKITTTHGKRPIAEVIFKDERYNPAGEMLLAERSFLPALLEAFESVLSGKEESAEFSGNAFTAFITKETTKVTNDINGDEAELPTADLKKLTKVYKRKNDRIQH